MCNYRGGETLEFISYKENKRNDEHIIAKEEETHLFILYKKRKIQNSNYGGSKDSRKRKEKR